MLSDAARQQCWSGCWWQWPFCPPAEAFTFQGRTESQRAYIQEVISHCWLPASETDAELRSFGPVIIVFSSLDVTSYASAGRIYTDLAVSEEILGELADHECCHEIWYSLRPKWWEKWASLCGGGRSEVWRLDFAENFAECAKVVLFYAADLLRIYAATHLEVIPPAELRAWLTLASCVNRCRFPDLYPRAMPSTAEADELAAAGGYLCDEGITKGYRTAPSAPPTMCASLSWPFCASGRDSPIPTPDRPITRRPPAARCATPSPRLDARALG